MSSQLDLFRLGHRPLDTEASSAAAASVSSGGTSAAGLAHGIGRAAARLQDPMTSHEAAASVRDLTEKQQAVLAFFQHYGPMTDEQLNRRYRHAETNEARHWIPGLLPSQTDSGLRTRRHELVEQGRLRDSGRKGTTRAGRASIIWETA